MNIFIIDNFVCLYMLEVATDKHRFLQIVHFKGRGVFNNEPKISTYADKMKRNAHSLTFINVTNAISLQFL